MNFTFGNQKWKGPATSNVFPSNSRPTTNLDADVKNLIGSYPSGKPPGEPVTTTKIGIIKNSPAGSRYTSVTFGPITCTNVGTTLPICYKKMPRPSKVWRKRLFPVYPSSSKPKPTIQQIDAPGTVIQATCDQNSRVLFTDITHLSKCNGIKTPKGCVGGTNAIRRSASTIVDKKYCTTTREYLQKRCKSFEQNQSIGKKISGTAFNSGAGFEVGDVTGNCNVIQYKPSNNTFKVQGGVSSSSRTALLKYQALNPAAEFQCDGPVPAEALKCFVPRQTAFKNPILNINKNNQCYKVIHGKSKLICGS